jgi:hypothetical protein
LAFCSLRSPILANYFLPVNWALCGSMKFHHHDLEFEIADSLLSKGAAFSFKPENKCYSVAFKNINDQAKVASLPFNDFEPLYQRQKNKGVFCDDILTADERVLRIIKWLIANNEIEPVVYTLSEHPNYKYKLEEGCHRFHVSLALGYSEIPSVMRTWDIYNC